MIGMRRNNDVTDALASLAPGASWVIRDNNYDEIEWQSEDIEMPTKEEIDAEIERLIEEEPYTVLREIRDWYLQKSDWTQAQDIRAIRGEQWCQAWDTYRQELRDLPENVSGIYFNEFNIIEGVTFPEAPNS
jgi:hypothetical protein